MELEICLRQVLGYAAVPEALLRILALRHRVEQEGTMLICIFRTEGISLEESGIFVLSLSGNLEILRGLRDCNF